MMKPRKSYIPLCFLGVCLLFAACTKSSAPAPQGPPPFHVGAVNQTEVIRQQKAFNGVSVELLEQRMRPGKLKRPAKISDPLKFLPSANGFLGPEEKLLEVLAADNEFVLNHVGKTHQALAQPLRDAVEMLRASGATELTVHLPKDAEPKSPYRVYVIHTAKECQPSPFEDNLCGSALYGINHLTTDAKLAFAEMTPELIQRYGFYEGKGTPWRVPPEAIIEVFDYLRPVR